MKTQKFFSYLKNGESAVRASERIVIVDDVLNKLTNANKAYSLAGVAERTVGVVGVWDRNPHREAGVLPVSATPIEAVILESIPAMLPASSELWQNA